MVTLAQKFLNKVNKSEINEMIKLQGSGEDLRYTHDEISINSLERDYAKYDTNTFNDEEVMFWFNVNTKVLIGVIETGEYYKKRILSLEFKEKVPSTINYKFNKALQVDKVYVEPKFRGSKLSQYAYVLLAYKGFNILSDFYQYEGGVQLWKSLSRTIVNKGLTNFTIRAIKKDSKFLKDESGNEIIYHADKHEDDKFWSNHPDLTKGNIMFLLSKNTY